MILFLFTYQNNREIVLGNTLQNPKMVVLDSSFCVKSPFYDGSPNEKIVL